MVDLDDRAAWARDLDTFGAALDAWADFAEVSGLASNEEGGFPSHWPGGWSLGRPLPLSGG
eukprot:8793372-Alexandrium_andersonii.AAC.1